MSKNKNLNNASKAKEDEFYTQLTDIETELQHYKKQFENKSVFCNCDDAYESNFFKYFVINFNKLGLKKLTTISYVSPPVSQMQSILFDDDKIKKHAFKIEITSVEDFNNDMANLLNVEYLLLNNKNVKTLLKNNGDFRSYESIEILKKSDIIVTNPPFSLFKEYIMLLIESGKRFLIIGNQNAITYKDIFPLIQSNKLWLGYKSGDMTFVVPDYYKERSTRFWIDENGTHWRSMGNICWFTNMDTIKRHKMLTLYKKYTPEEYPKYDTYDAINVNKISDIPYDYEGIIGVPITFMDKYNPNQFEIIGLDRYVKDNPNYGHRFKINGKEKYARILIKHKNLSDSHEH